MNTVMGYWSGFITGIVVIIVGVTIALIGWLVYEAYHQGKGGR